MRKKGRGSFSEPEMPMILHDGICQQACRMLVERLRQDSLQGVEVFVLMKQRQPGVMRPKSWTTEGTLFL